MKRKMNRITSMLLYAVLVFAALPEAVFAYAEKGMQPGKDEVLRSEK